MYPAKPRLGSGSFSAARTVKVMVQSLAPVRVGEGLLGLQAQAVARHHPADALDNAGPIRRAPAITGSSDLPPPGVTAASTSVMPVASPVAIAATRLTRAR